MATSLFHRNFPGVVQLQQAADTAAFLIGLDLHQKTTAICVIDPRTPDTPVFQRKRLPNAELLPTLQHFSGKKVVACEAAYGWFPLREALSGMSDVTLVLLDPRKTGSWIATSGIKNDRIDAQVLCHVCLHGGISCLAVHQPSAESRERWKLVQHRNALVGQRTKGQNRLKAIERDYGLNPFTGEISDRSALISSLASDLHRNVEDLERRIKEIEKQMTALIKDDAITKRLQSIPGIGPITAFALRHKIETIDRFENAAHLNSYFGFGVRQRQSGDTLVKGRIAKTGNTLIRTLLIQGAQVVRSRRPEYLPVYFPQLSTEERMRDRRHANKVVTALARKNLSFVYFVWKNSMPFSMERYRELRKEQVQTSVCDEVPAGPPAITCTTSPSCVPPAAADLVHPPAL